MSTNQNFKYSPSVLIYPLLILFSIWMVFWFQVRIDSSIKNYGIHPQKIEGLLGIITSPFLHGDIVHIYHNSLPLFVLSLALFYFYRKIAWRILLYSVFATGFLTWMIADKGNHIGASGVVYALVSFIFFKGVLAKHFRLIALSLLVIFLYGSMIWYVFPIKDGMSWEGHLSGLLTGFIFALIFRNNIAKPERYLWENPAYNEEEDPFMKHFDEDGNFIELEYSENQSEDEQSKVALKEKNPINYIYKSKDN